MTEDNRHIEDTAGVEPGPPRPSVTPGGTASTPSDSPAPSITPGGTASTPSDSRDHGRDGTRPSRKHPAHPPVVESFNRSVIVYVTLCTKDRHPVLANVFMHELLCRAWEGADRWRVGRYVVMPDHIHLFCAPGTLPPTSVKKWVEYWKGSVSRALKGHGPLAEYGRGGTRPSTPADSPPPSSTPGGTASTPSDSRDHGRGGTRPSTPCVPGDDGEDENRPSQWPETLWQRDCWDTQLRRGESYRAKWEYVLDNPVRAGLCESPDEWPYLGEMNVLQWHD